MPLGKRGIQRAEAYAVVDAAAEKLAHGQESADAAFYECLRTAVYDVIGIALGVNVVIATASGRGDAEAVRRTVHTAVTMSVVCGALIAAAGELAAPALLGMMNVPGEVLPHALTYLRIYLLGMPVILLYNFESAIFRSVGETAVPLRALFMSGILNVLLKLLFVIVFKMTVDGVAIATVIANAVSAAVLLRRLVRTEGHRTGAEKPPHRPR